MIIGGFHPLSLSDFPETPAAVLFLQGCNWQCRYCHNQELIPRKAQGPALDYATILECLRARDKILRGVVFTGGEPTLHNDLQQYMVRVKKLGLRIKLDSNGSHPRRLRSLVQSGVLDYIAMDIKAPLDKYEMITGTRVKKEDILESIDIISTSGIKHQFRTTWPTELLTQGDIEEIRSFLPARSPYVLQKCRR
ncbi:MAG: anaerobic ribonucleoside-triphosphate reductase activating protein [Deltaproteobacteria bacterium]|nr:MAG: anaerobic ribonucleoside-triphosphate reductase activating protein [Deltaproteobacteria bacterium]